MDPAFLKSLLWALVGIALHVSGAPPHGSGTAAPKDVRPRKEDIVMNTLVRYAAPALLTLSFLVTAAEILTIHSASFRHITSLPDSIDPANIDTPFVALCAILVGFCVFRLYCYQALGDLFTYDATIRPNHRLVTTGPYRLIRHPSYTGLFGSYACNMLLHFYSGDSWVVQYVFCLWLSLTAMVTFKLARRTKLEDEMLQNRFGAEWESYSLRVPYRLIPGIL